MAVPITVHFIRPDGSRRSLQARQGQSLMRVAVDAGIGEIAADCGGLLSCATCHVIVDATWVARLPEPSSDELSMLELTAAPRESGSRLSCQLLADDAIDGLVLRLPSRQY